MRYLQRAKWRYLLVEVVSDRNVSGEDLRLALEGVGKSFFGSVGLLQVSPKILRYDPIRGEAILKCRVESLDKVRSTVALLTQVSDQPAAAFVVRSSGTIRALTKKKASHR